MAQRSLLDFGLSKTSKRKVNESESEIDIDNYQPKKVQKPAPKYREFQSAWLQQFSWVEFNSEHRRLFCKTCRAAGIKNSFTTDGAGNLQRSTLVKHNVSKEHKHGVEAHHMRKQLYSTNLDEEVESDNGTPSVTDAEMHLFRTVHFCALNNLPNSMVNTQLEFLRASGVDPSITDIHASSVKEVQNSLVHILDIKLKERLKECDVFGLIIDESTDLALHKKLIIYIRYVTSGELRTELLGNIRIDNGQADTITEEMLGRLNTLGLDVKNLVGLGSDGASVMFGRKGGVGVRLREVAPHGECVEQFQDQLTVSGSKTHYKGIQLTHVNEKQQIDKLKANYIDSVVEKIGERLSTDKESVLQAFSSFEPTTCSRPGDTQKNLKILANHYNLDEGKLKREYDGVKALMSGSYKDFSFKDLTKTLLRRHSEEYPETIKALLNGLCIPVTSVECERGFSLQNRIKVKSRTCLNPENLEVLMRIARGPGLQEFPYEKAVVHWRNEKKRRLAKLYQPRK